MHDAPILKPRRSQFKWDSQDFKWFANFDGFRLSFGYSYDGKVETSVRFTGYSSLATVLWLSFLLGSVDNKDKVSAILLPSV